MKSLEVSRVPFENFNQAPRLKSCHAFKFPRPTSSLRSLRPLTCNLRGYLGKCGMLQDLDLSLSVSLWAKDKQSKLIRGEIVTQKQIEVCVKL